MIEASRRDQAADPLARRLLDARQHGEFGLKEVPPHHFSSFAVQQ
jgi:hypothetical protein